MPQTPSRRLHPEEETLQLFLEGRLPEEAQTSTEMHLRTGCVPCLFAARKLALELTADSRRALAKGLFSPDDTACELDRYGTWLERKVLLIDLEAVLVADLTSELMLRPAAARREVVRKTLRYQILALSESLREESRREGFRDVARAVELAELAVEVADCLDPLFYGASLVTDARALAYAILGNAYRITGDLFGAERHLRTAVDLLQLGTQAPTEEAEVFSLVASLRTDLSQFDAAIELLTIAASHYRSQGLDRLEGKTLIKMAIAAGRSDAPDQAVELASRAVELLDEVDDVDMICLARHNIAASLVDANRFEEARDYLARIAPLYEQLPEDRGFHLRRRWTEGLVAAGLGAFSEAEKILDEVRVILRDQDRALDTALVSLDLAVLYLNQGRADEVKRLAEEMYPIFRSQDVHRQALAALVLFKQAVLSEAVTVGFVRDVATYLDRARNNPYLAFRPTST